MTCNMETIEANVFLHNFTCNELDPLIDGLGKHDCIEPFRILKGSEYEKIAYNIYSWGIEFKTISEEDMRSPHNIHVYDNSCCEMLKMPLTTELFKGNQLKLLIASLTQFKKYSGPARTLLKKLKNMDKQTGLERFLYAQAFNYESALDELKTIQQKVGHWMWFIFPQLKGLGHSKLSQYYGLNGQEEAKEYINHPLLGKRLKEITQVVLDIDKPIQEIFGDDTIKFRACMILFASSCDEPIFKQACQKYNWII